MLLPVASDIDIRSEADCCCEKRHRYLRASSPTILWMAGQHAQQMKSSVSLIAIDPLQQPLSVNPDDP